MGNLYKSPFMDFLHRNKEEINEQQKTDRFKATNLFKNKNSTTTVNEHISKLAKELHNQEVEFEFDDSFYKHFHFAQNYGTAATHDDLDHSAYATYSKKKDFIMTVNCEFHLPEHPLALIIKRAYLYGPVLTDRHPLNKG